MAKRQGGLGPVRHEGRPGATDAHDKDDTLSPRLLTPLHLPAANSRKPPSQAGFRVVSIRREGLVALVCLAPRTARPWTACATFESLIGREIVELGVQQWVGSVLEGRWEGMRR